MIKLLKNKNFFLLFQGAFVSEIGNMLYNTAMMLYVLEQTGSELQMSIFMAIAVLTRVIFSPIAGVITDRFDRIKIIYVADFIRGIVFFGLAFVFFGEYSLNTTLIALYAITILSSINAAFFTPAVSSSIPDIVGENNLQAAQGIQGFLMQIPSIIGLAFGAALYDLVNIELIILINAITFMLSGFSEMFIKTPYKKVKKEIVEIDANDKKSMMEDYLVSLKYIKENGLLNMILFFLVINFAVIPIVSIGPPVLFKVILERANTMEYAGTGMVFGVSAMIGAILIGSMTIKSYRNTITKSVLLLGVLFGLNALLFHLVATGVITYWLFYGLYLGLILIMAINLNAVNIPVNIGFTLSVEPEMRGRVFSTVGALSMLGVPFAMIFGGLVLEYSTISILGLISAIIMLIPTLGFSLNKRVRDLLVSLDDKVAKVKLEELEEIEKQKIIKEQEETEIY